MIEVFKPQILYNWSTLAWKQVASAAALLHFWRQDHFNTVSWLSPRGRLRIKEAASSPSCPHRPVLGQQGQHQELIQDFSLF